MRLSKALSWTTHSLLFLMKREWRPLADIPEWERRGWTTSQRMLIVVLFWSFSNTSWIGCSMPDSRLSDAIRAIYCATMRLLAVG